MGGVRGSDGGEVNTFASPAWPENRGFAHDATRVTQRHPSASRRPGTRSRLEDCPPAMHDKGQIGGGRHTSKEGPAPELPWVLGAFPGV